MIMPKLFKTVLFAVVAALSVSDASAAQNKAFFKNLPKGCDPVVVGRNVVAQFLRTRPENYIPPGYRGNGYCDKGQGGGKWVPYAVVSIWANAMDFVRLLGDKESEEKLIRLYDDFLPGGAKHHICSRPYHVDDSIFGSVPIQIYLLTGDARHYREGLRYADIQWSPPCEGTIKERHAAPQEVQEEYWRLGYTPQTRLWIDDMYMITVLQNQAYRATGDRKYIERAAKEMCFYLDKIQLKKGEAKGLFYHAPDVPYVWGRGDGWMAAGMALVLKSLPVDSEYRLRIMAGYRMMMESLLEYQRPDGMWSQLVTEPNAKGNWAETSCTAMFTYAFVTGVKYGWLDETIYGEAARKAWIALCGKLDEYGNLADVCCGTGKENSRQYYFDRIRVHGDPHGQAPMLWCALELVENLGLKPTFVNCGVEFECDSPVEDIRLEYLERGGGWKAVDALEFPYFPDDKAYRGSIRNLKEDTPYLVRLVSKGVTFAQGTFRTWKSEVPIAKTVEISAGSKLPIVISERGTEDGWVRVVAKNGGALDFGEGRETPIVVRGARYVVLDSLRILGSRANNAVEVQDAKFVRFRNCDISRWGRVGVPRFDKRGWLFEVDRMDEKWGIVYDAAIKIGTEVSGCVVERCWIHDPRGRANSWFYSHPSGPVAILMARPSDSTVIRWNDLAGSDLHRYNDVIEGVGNFDRNGGFNRDADIYGNFMAFSNDDCIELDGGQRNVRCFGNRFESSYCGVSVQGCMMGPAYVYDNLFSGMCGEFGETGQTLKTGGGEHGKDAVVFIDGNVFWGKGSGITMRKNLRSVVRGNVFCDAQEVSEKKSSPASYYRRNLLNEEIDEEKLDWSILARPTPFTLDRERFSGVKVALGKAEPEAIAVTVRGGAKAANFEILKNGDCDWFDVSPSQSVVASGGEVKLAVKFNPKRMRSRRHYRGLFLVRTPDGLSRPVSIFAETDFVPPYKADKPGDLAIYHPAFKEGAWTALCKGNECGKFVFDVPKDGRYYFMVRSKGWLRPKAAVDDDEPKVCRLQNTSYPTWTMIAPGKDFGDMCRHYDLKKGRHTLKIWNHAGNPIAEGLVLTDNPLSFEPR